MRYSLASVQLAIKSNDEAFNKLFGDLKIGGEGDAVGSINVQTNTPIWQTQGFATGAWVHNKSLDRSGRVSVQISQLSDAVAKFKTACNYYYSDVTDGVDNNQIDGLTLVLTQGGKEIAKATDCYITQVPPQEHSEQAGNQTWEFTCGRITFN